MYTVHSTAYGVFVYMMLKVRVSFILSFEWRLVKIIYYYQYAIDDDDGDDDDKIGMFSGSYNSV